MTINPKTLRSYRQNKNLSQAELARISRVGKKTISRIELGEVSNPNQNTKNRLAEALQVKVEDLASEQTKVENAARKLGYRKGKFYLDPESAGAYLMVQHRYGVSPFRLVNMAPLLMAVLAEGSLQWRRQKVSDIESAVSALSAIADDAPHMAYANAGVRADNALGPELESIEAADIFGKEIGEEPYNFDYNDGEHNPFADYIRYLCRYIDPKVLEIDPDFLKSLLGVPSYRISPLEIDRLTCGDTWAEFAIEHGHVSISDIPKELISDGHDEARVAWITAKIPEEARRQHQEWLDSLDLDFKDILGEASHD